MNYSKLFGLVGIAIFIYILFNINIFLLIHSFREINLILFIASLSLLIPCTTLKGFKWSLLIEKKYRLSLLESMLAWTVGFGYG